MTYWHMQLHPNDLTWKREKELLEKTTLIGLGLTDSEQAYNDFKSMQIDDIVLIKHGANPIALVKVIGELEDIKNNDFNQIDWFQLRRKIEVLDILGENRFDFPQPRKTLQKSITKSSLTYKYIDNWYKSIAPEALTNFKGIKLTRIEIEKFKMFKNFNISFQKDDEILPIVVIAGINGSGKTSLLEYINDFTTEHLVINDKSLIKYSFYDEDSKTMKVETINYENILDKTIIGANFKNNIEYLPTDTHKNLQDIENAIKSHLKQLIWEDKYSVDEAYDEIKSNISKIFDDLGFNINFHSLDKNEEIYFSKKDCESLDCAFKLNEISTGQKTLLTKVLYLYLNDVRDKVVLIDEPELSLHPSWQSKIFQVYENFAKENNCQVIMATHSPHIIAQVPHKYLRFLAEEDGMIISKLLNASPLDRDLNTIVKTIMGTDYIPKWLEDSHFEYRKLCEDGKEDTQEAKKLKDKILEYESPNSSFFQGLAFDMELMR